MMGARKADPRGLSNVYLVFFFTGFGADFDGGLIGESLPGFGSAAYIGIPGMLVPERE